VDGGRPIRRDGREVEPVALGLPHQSPHQPVRLPERDPVPDEGVCDVRGHQSGIEGRPHAVCARLQRFHGTADGRLLYIRRPYEPLQGRAAPPLTVLKDIFLFPFRVIRSAFDFLNAFSMAFSQKPLTCGM